ncbi:hypothetical protein HELRODRAFT_132363, partial [Helobdella robusta]|uniref:non-specific serine/threonine protein kinase n=1 Tax=Helobdella robusta TaxID=6412 RepID=T1EHY1_HELRO
YERLSYESLHNQQCMKDIVLGRRIGFYRLKEQIGSGNFSQVRLGTHLLTHNKVAVKILDKIRMEHKVRRLLSREISTMESLHHPNIIRFYEMIETLSKIFIIMEYASEGELYTRVSSDGKLPEDEAKMIFAQIISAVQHMHNKSIIHRDLKAENVFFANRVTVKVGDFGFSNYCEPKQLLSTFCGSPPYAAPELFNESSYYGMYVDIWALGVLLYFVVVGHLPFRADTIGILKKCINDCDMEIPEHVSGACQFLIRSILRLEPTDRLTLDEITRTEWMNGCHYPKALSSPSNLETIPKLEEHPSEEHLETRRRLYELGISEEHITYALNKQCRSSVAGTYQIVLHQIQKDK